MTPELGIVLWFALYVVVLLCLYFIATLVSEKFQNGQWYWPWERRL
jgi:hypothetical protein